MPPSPDLSVLSKHEQWVDEGLYKVFFVVENTGNVIIPSGHDVSLSVDGIPLEQIPILQPLAPGEIYLGNFASIVQLSGSYDEIIVCTDTNYKVAEVNEDNNCLANTWRPGVHLSIQPSEETVAVV